MKIQCDVCERREAVVFCVADEAVLCESCDKRVHHANKLAIKHQRFFLLNPCVNKEAPPQCDICQERGAILFCREDRSILCRECDIPTHKTNEHTQKHNRFLLTGAKLSASSSIYQSNSVSSSIGKSKPTMSLSSNDATTNRGYGYHTPVAACESSGVLFNNNMSSNGTVPVTTPAYGQTSEEGSISTSDYMMDSPCGGWRLEDLIDVSKSSGSQFFCI